MVTPVASLNAYDINKIDKYVCPFVVFTYLTVHIFLYTFVVSLLSVGIMPYIMVMLPLSIYPLVFCGYYIVFDIFVVAVLLRSCVIVVFCSVDYMTVLVAL